MSSLNLDEVLSKIDELRNLFELGQRTMPFLEELFHFLEEIEPLLDEINTSIRESTDRMPDAKSKLESVSAATEMATTEILDLVDGVAFELKMMQRALTRKTEGLDAVREADERLLHLLGQELGDEHAELLDEVERIHRRKQPLLDEAIDHADDELEAVDDVQEKMTQITMALQVQDITSQQIAAANHIIESLRDRMAQLVHSPSLLDDEPEAVDDDTDGAADNDAVDEAVDTEAVDDASAASNEEDDEGDGTFDGNARYEPTGDHQNIADALIDSIRRKVDEPAPGAPGDPPPAADDEATDASPAEEVPDLGGDGDEIAQEDIDELFS